MVSALLCDCGACVKDDICKHERAYALIPALQPWRVWRPSGFLKNWFSLLSSPCGAGQHLLRATERRTFDLSQCLAGSGRTYLSQYRTATQTTDCNGRPPSGHILSCSIRKEYIRNCEHAQVPRQSVRGAHSSSLNKCLSIPAFGSPTEVDLKSMLAFAPKGLLP